MIRIDAMWLSSSLPCSTASRWASTAPASLCRTRGAGVEVRAADVLHSDWNCTLENIDHQPAVRLGLRLVDGLKAESAQRIAQTRQTVYFESAEELARVAELEQPEMRQLAAADALQSLSGHRRQQVWDAAARKRAPQLLRQAPVDEPVLELTPAAEGEEVIWGYRTLGLTLRSHPKRSSR